MSSTSHTLYKVKDKLLAVIMAWMKDTQCRENVYVTFMDVHKGEVVIYERKNTGSKRIQLECECCLQAKLKSCMRITETNKNTVPILTSPTFSWTTHLLCSKKRLAVIYLP